MNNNKHINTACGPIEYTLSGSSGSVVLIVHGGHSSCNGSFHQEQLLANGFRVLIPSRPGYGRTPINSGKTAESTAELFVELLKELRIDTVAVLGISAGGPTALQFVGNFPDKVSCLILESAVVKPWFHLLTVQYYGVKFLFHPKRQKRFWEKLRLELESNELKTLRKNMKLFTKINPVQFLNSLRDSELSELKNAVVYGNDSGEGFVYDIDHRSGDITGIQCPVLIMHSVKDASVPFSHALYAQKMIKDSELFSVSSQSHFIDIGPGADAVLAKRLDFLIQHN